MFVAMPVDGAKALDAAGALLTRATAGITADGFAMNKRVQLQTSIEQ